MKIRTRIIISIVCIAFFSFLISIFYGYFEMRKNALDNTEEKLNVIADLQESRVENLININLERIKIFTSRVGVIDLMQDYYNNPDSIDKDDLSRRLEDAKKSSTDYNALWITDKDGKVIASSEKDQENKNFSSEEYFEFGKEKNYITFVKDEENKENWFYLAGPIQKDENVLGVSIVQTSPEEIINIMNDYSGLGETGETIIARLDENNDVEYFLETRHPYPPGVKVTKLDTHIPLVQALLNNEDYFTDLADYRNEKVFSASRYIDHTGWGLVVKIDQKEVFAPINHEINILIVISLVYLLFSFAVALFVARILSKPIENLHKGIKIIQKGDLDYKVGNNSKDEIGDLSREIDNLTSAIKVSRAEIDKKVEEQTKEIKLNDQKMQNQQKAILNILEDVNEEKLKTEHERNKIQAILSSIGDAVFVIGLDEKIIMFNSIAEKISGYTKEEAVGKVYKDILKFYLEKDNSINDKFVRDAMTSGTITYMTNHTYLLTKYNKKIPVADSASPLRDNNNKIIGCVVVFHDVSKERELAKMKDEFLNIAAHDLRTPMTAIKGYNDMILNGDFGQIPETLREPLKETQSASERLIRMVNDFLTSSRIEKGKITIQPKNIDIIPIVKTLIKQISPIAEKKGLEFKLEEIPEQLFVYTDSDKIQQVLTNLIDNAIKYTKSGWVKFDIQLKDKFAQFSISDSGQGISEEKQEALFTKYYQVSGGTKKVIEGQGQD